MSVKLVYIDTFISLGIRRVCIYAWYHSYLHEIYAWGKL